MLFVYLISMDSVTGRRKLKNQKRPNTETELKNEEKIRIPIMNPPSWVFMLLPLLGLSTFGSTCYLPLLNAIFFCYLFLSIFFLLFYVQFVSVSLFFPGRLIHTSYQLRRASTLEVRTCRMRFLIFIFF